MLTKKLQIQALADRIAGFNVDYPSRYFREPWLTCWKILDEVDPPDYRDALRLGLENHPERQEINDALMAAAPGYKQQFPSLEHMSASLPPIEWLWPGWLPRGMLTVLGAAPGAGKSFVGLDLAWRILMNQGYPDGSPIAKSDTNVIYVDGEAVPQILNERAAHYGIDRKRLYMLLPDSGETIDFNAQKYQDRLINMVATLQPELVIIDSLSSIHTRGQNNVEDVRGLLSFLIQITESHRIGMLLIHHIRKPGNGQKMAMYGLSMEDLSGSAHIIAMARVVWGIHVARTGPKPDPNGPRVFQMIKTNLGPFQPSLGFEFAPLHPKGVCLKWQQEAPKTYREPTKEDVCTAWLLDLLRDGPMKPKEVCAKGSLEGFSRTLIYNARSSVRDQIETSDGKNSPQTQWKLVEA